MWHRASLVDSEVAGPGLSLVRVAVPPEVASGFEVPGQFSRVRLAGLEATFAIASAPGHPSFEFFVRTHGDVARALTSLTPGETFELSDPEGPGFPVERVKGRSLLLVGTGTGWAPLRSVALHVRGRRADWKQVRGLYGALTPEHVVFDQELTALRDAAIEVKVTVTEPMSSWTGPVGRVQALLPADGLEDTVALLCGQPEMTDDVAGLLRARGLPAANAWLNF